jgi:hypothetical protein
MRLPRLTSIPTRLLALIWLVALAAEVGLTLAFQLIPQARSFVPLRIVRDPSAYEWSPASAPSWFHPSSSITPELAALREAIQHSVDPQATTWDRQVAIMNWVRQQALTQEALRPINADPLRTWQAMQAGVPAQCTDFVNLTAAALISMGLPEVRVWHLVAGDGWNQSGHVVVEVWVPERSRWVMLDPMNNAYVLAEGEPASVLEIRSSLLTGQRGGLQPIVGPNSHLPSTLLLDLYAHNMDLVRVESSFTLLADADPPSGIDRVIASLPDVMGLPDLAAQGVRLLNGRARHVILIDTLTSPAAHRLPIRRVKALFLALLANTALLFFLAITFLVRVLRSVWLRGA